MDKSLGKILTATALPFHQYIARARHQTRAGLGALSELSAVWKDVPDTMELGVVDLFLSHLRGETVPSTEDPPVEGQLGPSDFAHQSLLGLTEMDRRLDDPKYIQQSDAILAAWPGIFKWAHYLVKRYLASREKERNGLPKFHTMVRFLNVYAQLQKLVVPMVETPGCVEIVAECWMVDDFSRSAAQKSDGILSLATTMTTHALAILLKESTAPDILNRLVETAGGDAESVLQLLLRRTKQATRKLGTHQDVYTLLWDFNLVNELCCPIPPQALRQAFFGAGGVTVMTHAFVAVSKVIDQQIEGATENALLASCIMFFVYYLEGDDYLSILHAIKAGFLHAFLECAPATSQMKQWIIDEAVAIVRDVLPPYLVYSSVFEAVLPFLEDVKSVPHFKRYLENPVVRATFEPLLTFAERRRPTRQLEHAGPFTAIRNVAIFRDLVKRDFPDTPVDEVALCIDFSRIPENYSVTTAGPQDERRRILQERCRERACPVMECLIRNGNTIESIWTSVGRLESSLSCRILSTDRLVDFG
ncbi:hypothetical protein FB45DRAFT_1059887 [Roridomyces roridus]|uniref:Uncharacterized protein n=1 Tax=Roridomyces roridus TaxID=1738132 RepID=A0AAD7BPK3_9AGAR|nr:hypothetical protein FB45DRAFT_1059887 [Roridomyces roridus]